MLRIITFMLCLIAASTTQAAAAERELLTSTHFAIEGPGGDRTVRFLADNADAIAESVSSQLGFPLGRRMHIIVAPDRTSFNSAQPPGAHLPDWVVGTAYPPLGLIVLLKEPRGNILRTLEHEVCHILLGRAFGPDHRIPRWLHEGMSIIIAGEWSMQRLSTMTMAVLTGRLLNMDDIAHSCPRDGRLAELAYCQSFYFISFLKSKFGDDDFRTFLQVYSIRRDFRQALRKTYYLDWEELEAQWLDYLKVRFSWIPILSSTGTLWFLASIVFIWGYVHKKRKNRKKLQQWELEDLLSGESGETRH